MGLKYIYAGYSKCGTKTIAKVFRTLGFNVFDYEENTVYLLQEWIAYFDPKKTKEERIAMLRVMLKDVDVITDQPGFLLWAELMEAFPEAKCIFWERRLDK